MTTIMVFRLLVLAIVLSIAAIVHVRRRRGEFDSEWERRWYALPRGERRRIARAAQRGEMLADPDEAELAAGSASRQRPLGSYIGGRGWILIAGGLLLVVAAAAGGSVPLVALGGTIAALGVGMLLHGRRLAENLERAERLNSR